MSEIKKEDVVTIDKNSLKLLVFLIIAMIVVDMISVTLYLSMKSGGFTSTKTPSSTNNNQVAKSDNVCKDNTPYDSCSKTKPFYCYNGQLVTKAVTCGCPEGQVLSFQDCKRA